MSAYQSNLKKGYQRSMKRAVKEPSMPEWYPLLGGGLLVLVLFGLIFRVGNPQEPALSAPTPPAVTAPAEPITTTGDDSAVTTTSEPAQLVTDDIQLQTSSGAVVVVPASAFNAAFGSLTTERPTAEVDPTPTVAFFTEERIVFSFRVIDGGTAVNAVVVADLTDGTWVTT